MHIFLRSFSFDAFVWSSGSRAHGRVLVQDSQDVELIAIGAYEVLQRPLQGVEIQRHAVDADADHSNSPTLRAPGDGCRVSGSCRHLLHSEPPSSSTAARPGINLR